LATRLVVEDVTEPELLEAAKYMLNLAKAAA
jgi:hypothetical protein